MRRFLLSSLLILMLSLCACSNDNDSSSVNTNSNNYSSNTSTNQSYTSSSPKKPLTKEQADSYRGTGYNNTRPNSVAEDIELKAAQVKCEVCGNHSDNGYNSKCDSCQKKYGH